MSSAPARPTGPPPTFAIVGRVNKGKSSIVATLAEDDSVAIAPTPGTTTRCREFPVEVDGVTLFTLVDTPGFEQAARALAWMKERSSSAASRAATVADLVAELEGTAELQQECRLLRPILDGAGILYVVDGTRPYRPNYEAEMEILRWTGRPTMALINRIGSEDHAEQWRRALNQYFKVVRDFDAHSATFGERVRLLRTFRELREEWVAPLDFAIFALEREHERRRREAIAIIADMLVAQLTLTLRVTLKKEEPLENQRERLEERFHDALRTKEVEARHAIERLYRHHRHSWTVDDLQKPAFDSDLFAEETWKVLGMPPRILLPLYMAGGAATGGSIDAAVGGASMLAGAAVGGLSGLGIGLFQLGRRFAKATAEGGLAGSVRAAFGGGRMYRIGPHSHLNFPWVLLDRALLHLQSVTSRAHARTDTPQVTVEGDGLVAKLDSADRKRLNRTFWRVRKKASDVPLKLVEEVHRQVGLVCERLIYD